MGVFDEALPRKLTASYALGIGDLMVIGWLQSLSSKTTSGLVEQIKEEAR